MKKMYVPLNSLYGLLTLTMSEKSISILNSFTNNVCHPFLYLFKLAFCIPNCDLAIRSSASLRGFAVVPRCFSGMTLEGSPDSSGLATGMPDSPSSSVDLPPSTLEPSGIAPPVSPLSGKGVPRCG